MIVVKKLFFLCGACYPLQKGPSHQFWAFANKLRTMWGSWLISWCSLHQFVTTIRKYRIFMRLLQCLVCQSIIFKNFPDRSSCYWYVAAVAATASSQALCWPTASATRSDISSWYISRTNLLVFWFTKVVWRLIINILLVLNLYNLL